MSRNDMSSQLNARKQYTDPGAQDSVKSAQMQKESQGSAPTLSYIP